MRIKGRGVVQEVTRTLKDTAEGWKRVHVKILDEDSKLWIEMMLKVDILTQVEPGELIEVTIDEGGS